MRRYWMPIEGIDRNGATPAWRANLDRFKDINDSFGHPFGDACLRHVAAVLRKSFRRDSDTPVRFGGEEFVVIAVGSSAAENMERLEAFRREIEQSLIALDSRQSRLTLSIGVWSGVPNFTGDPARLLKSADAALYRAKRERRNRLIVAEHRTNELSASRVS